MRAFNGRMIVADLNGKTTAMKASHPTGADASVNLIAITMVSFSTPQHCSAYGIAHGPNSEIYTSAHTGIKLD